MLNETKNILKLLNKQTDLLDLAKAAILSADEHCDQVVEGLLKFLSPKQARQAAWKRRKKNGVV